jgi:hypothetical protein
MAPPNPAMTLAMIPRVPTSAMAASACFRRIADWKSAKEVV